MSDNETNGFWAIFLKILLGVFLAGLIFFFCLPVLLPLLLTLMSIALVGILMLWSVLQLFWPFLAVVAGIALLVWLYQHYNRRSEIDGDDE